MGSSEEIYWNMAKKQWKVGRENAIMPSFFAITYL